MRRILRFVILSLAVGSIAPVSHAGGNPVPDEASAVRVAEKVLIPIYGQKQIESERPFTARLHGNVWIVYGHLPPESDGGVAEVKVDKRNGRILSVTHGK